MFSKLLSCLVLIGLLHASGAQAHHSFAAEFSYDEFGTIEGEVIEVLFVNPHARFFVAVINEAGEEEIWDTQTSSSVGLTRFEALVAIFPGKQISCQSVDDPSGIIRVAVIEGFKQRLVDSGREIQRALAVQPGKPGIIKGLERWCRRIRHTGDWPDLRPFPFRQGDICACRTRHQEQRRREETRGS